MRQQLYDRLINGYLMEYTGPAYEITKQVSTFHSITRFGRSSDLTDVLSSDQDAQADYVAGLIVLVVFSLLFFIFWTVALMTFKCMDINAGFLSGRRFIKASDDDDTSRFNGPVTARVIFLLATIILWLSAVSLLIQGVTELDNTANAADSTLSTLRNKIQDAEDITGTIQEIGIQSVKIRDKVMYLFDTVLCESIESAGISLGDLKETAREDLNQLSNFLYDSLVAFLSGIDTVDNLTTSAESVVSEVRLLDWPAILVSGLLFILPAFFVVGVYCAFKNVTAKRFEMYLSYVVLPLFMGVICFCIIVCCVLIPVAAVNADFCTGSTNSGGPDDTILTSYRNLLGNDVSIRFRVVAFYTQRCLPQYYPYGFLGAYFDQLDTARSSIDDLIEVLSRNLNTIRDQCGTDDGELFLSLAQSMKSNLDLLKETVDNTLNLVNCKDINIMYVSAVHTATCTHAPAALGWIYGTLLTISISGMIMISFRSSYLAFEQKADTLVKKKAPETSNTRSNTSIQRHRESEVRMQKLYRDRQSKVNDGTDPRNIMGTIPEEYAQNTIGTTPGEYAMPSSHHHGHTSYVLPSSYESRNCDLGFVITTVEDDDVSALD